MWSKDKKNGKTWVIGVLAATLIAAANAGCGGGANPAGMPLSPAPRAYVANRLSASVSVIATATNTVVATVASGSGPVGVAVTPDGSRAYVTNTASNNVSVIATATNTVVATVGVGNGPFGVAIH